MSPPRRISVVLSAKNASDDVEGSLRSVLLALGPDDEVVAIDDGSSDDTHARMVQSLHGIPHQVLRTPGVGLTAALRLGTRAASGELIARLDAGDTMTRERLTLQARAFSSDPGLVACGGNVRFVDAARRPVGRSAFATTDLGIRVCFLGMASPFVHSTLCFRRSAFDAVGGYRDFFKCAQDFDLLLRLSRVGRLRNLPGPVGDYLVSSGGISATRGLEQHRFGILAWQSHMAARLGLRSDPLATARDLAAWQRWRITTMRRLRREAGEARARGDVARAQLLEMTSRCLTPMPTVVAAAVRGVERLSTMLPEL